MKCYVSPFILLLFFLFSCVRKKEQLVKSDSDNTLAEIFSLTTDSQNAVFFIGTGYMGEGSSMPLIDPTTNELKEYNGNHIYLDKDYEQQVMDKLPPCISGTPEIKVMARIRLKETTGIASTEEPKITHYYEAEVIELKDIFVKSEPCL